MTPQPETDRDVQMLYAQHLRKEMGSIWRAEQSRMLITNLTDSQKYVLEQFYKQAVRQAEELKAKAGAHAMWALLEPHVGQHQVRAFFHHAKAVTLLKEKSRVASQLSGYYDGFPEFVRDIGYGLRSSRELHDHQAVAHTHAMLGLDSLSEQYAQLRIQSAKAQGTVEGYDDLAELFEELMTSPAAAA